MKIQVNDLVLHVSLQVINQGKPYRVIQLIEDKNLAQVRISDMVFWIGIDELRKVNLPY